LKNPKQKSTGNWTTVLGVSEGGSMHGKVLIFFFVSVFEKADRQLLTAKGF
jgi:hypothetical protein